MFSKYYNNIKFHGVECLWTVRFSKMVLRTARLITMGRSSEIIFVYMIVLCTSAKYVNNIAQNISFGALFIQCIQNANSIGEWLFFQSLNNIIWIFALEIEPQIETILN